MNAQLQRVEAEFRSAQDRLDRLAADVPDELWPVRPAPERWSVAECVAHLNLTAEAFVPALREALAEAARTAPRTARRYRRDPAGFLLSVLLPPPVRFTRVKTTPPFEPAARAAPAEIRERFRVLQQEQVALLHEADGLPLNQIRIRSPFNERLSYNAYSSFVILPRHQHRHLWQAERAAEQAGSR